MTTITLNGRTQPATAAVHSSSFLDGVRRTLSEWQRRRRQRRELQQFLAVSPMIDRDLALSRGDLEFEAQKPFWRA